MKKLNKIEDLRPAPYSPRPITDKAASRLGKSLNRFGDIAGIVWNKRTGHLVAGHQRVEQLRKAGATMKDGALGAYQPTLKATGFSRQMVTALGADLADKPMRFVGKKHATQTAYRLVNAWFAVYKIDLWVSARSKRSTAWYFGCKLRPW